MTVKTRNPGYLIAILSALILSTTGVFIAYLSREFRLPPLVLSFWREFFVFVLLLIVLGVGKPRSLRLTKSKAAFFLPFGLILAVFNAFWTLSVAMNGASLATFLVYTSPVFTALLGTLLLKERMDPVRWVCVVLSLAGCLLISGFLGDAPASIRPVGLLMGLLSGLAYALYTIVGREAGTKSETADVWSALCWIFGIASVFMFLFNLLLRRTSVSGMFLGGDLFYLRDSVKGWLVLLLLAGLPTLTGYGCYNMSLKYLPPLPVSLIASSEPLFTALLAFFILGEGMSPSAVWGGFFILSAVVIVHTGFPGFGKTDSLTG